MEIGIARIYATALFEAADDNGSVDEVKDELIQLDKIFEKEKDFDKLMINPAISNASKKEMMKEIFEGKISKEVLSFLCILIDKNRQYNFHNIVRQYCDIFDEETGIGEGVIYSAVKLTDAQMKKFQEETGRLLQKNVMLRNKVDTSLIGGVKIFVDGKIVDASLRSRLDKLAEQIKNS
ncbi:F0F1 ATP synthase subunit delta [Aminicella lysinilytica]|uniref:ATP synthase subunit delta n=1 Tax=Aminicella lysinilytica TaxID=433323 RepID=A0A4R6Q8N1_9FIRM|nr:F0F1 ATP synthase subunit delta [Aminicella lysinilytica]NLD10639.1 F0F1 ATP synthase subunit delta [Clostridiales bacterium]TDP58944.1 ATP synthase F1 subcomplex delta subunit [Aminicella lysinilytica]